MPSVRTLTVLQLGRAAAALAVVGFHTNLYSKLGPGALSAILQRGYLGVDFFFVLSGFIIFHVHGEGNQPNYAAARLRRIFVPYLPIGVTVAALAMIAPTLKGAGAWGWFQTLTLVPFGPDPALGVAWTLRHEMVFYVLFGCAMQVERPLLLAAAWPIAILAALLFGLEDPYILGPINLEFVFGMVAAWAVAQDRFRSSRCSLACGIAFVCFLASGAAMEWRLLFGFAVAWMLVPLVRAERAGKIEAPAVWLLLGNASYSIYLLHNPALTVIARLPLHPYLIAAIAAPVAVFAGLGYHLLYERPALQWLRGRPRSRLGLTNTFRRV